MDDELFYHIIYQGDLTTHIKICMHILLNPKCNLLPTPDLINMILNQTVRSPPMWQVVLLAIQNMWVKSLGAIHDACLYQQEGSDECRNILDVCYPGSYYWHVFPVPYEYVSFLSKIKHHPKYSASLSGRKASLYNIIYEVFSAMFSLMQFITNCSYRKCQGSADGWQEERMRVKCNVACSFLGATYLWILDGTKLTLNYYIEAIGNQVW